VVEETQSGSSAGTQTKCCKQEFLKQLDRIRDHDEPMESVGSY
jgi:hypothetical protein